MDYKIYTFALAAHGEGISGGDRIFIEFARYWSQKYPVTIFLWEEGYEMLKRQQAVSEKGKVPASPAFGVASQAKRGEQSAKLKIQISQMKSWSKLGFIVNYFARIVEGIRLGLITKLENSKDTIVYSASEFWMDSLPAFILKIRYPKLKWIAAWYQTAPNPLKGFSGSIPYWLVQLPVKHLIDKFADFVLVNNDLEKKVFKRLDRKNKAIIVLGAIDLKGIKKWQKAIGKGEKIYDAVFQGRFHPQKGVIELVDIWRRVVNKIPDAKLAMIGDGPLMKSVKFKVQSAKLENNIILTGYLFEGEEKYKMFVQSKIVVHPAIFDSGGMASAEAMAFGLPCVGFNLKSYKYYYPTGMEKVKEGDLRAFADKVLELLQDDNLYKRVASEALHLINYKWSWEYRARQILKAVLE